MKLLNTSLAAGLCCLLILNTESIGAEDQLSVEDLRDSYNQERTEGFLKVHLGYRKTLDKLLANRLAAQDLQGSNQVQEEIDRVKARVALLQKAEPVAVPKPIPTIGESNSPTFDDLAAAHQDYRERLVRGLSIINAEYAKRATQAQKLAMANADLVSANATEEFKSTLLGEVADLTEPTQPETGPVPIDLLDPEHREKWHITLGEWKFRGPKLTGEGNSRIDYRDTISPPFTLTFDMRVLIGSRPRIYLGDLTIGNDGSNFQLIFFPRTTDQTPVPYENRERISVRVVADSKFTELYVEDELVSRREPGLAGALTELGFAGGDGFSQGTTEFSNIELLLQD